MEQVGETSKDMEEMVGIDFRSLHEALEKEGHESREEMTKRLAITKDNNN